MIETLPGNDARRKHIYFQQQLTSVYMEILLRYYREADIVVDVFDRYNYKVSVKSAASERRPNAGPGGRHYQLIAGRSIPQRKEFMALSENKESISLSVNMSSKTRQSQPENSLAGDFSESKTTMCLSAHG